jgi:hypothetical protein
MSFRTCSEVSPTCPVAATVYGYYPNLPANATLVAVFGALAVAQIVLGYTKRVYSYTAVVFMGCVLEACGYGGRLMLNENPWNSTAFRLQVCCLVLAPSFIAAGIYFSLKHIVRHNGPEYSRLQPRLYTWIFIGCDLGSIVLQAVGGGIASSGGNTNRQLVDTGNWIIVAGIAFQVATMAFCGLLAAEYVFRFMRGQWRVGQAVESQREPGLNKASLFHFAVVFAYITVLIRCIYRVPEMTGGWGNPKMRIEKEFLLLDGLMIALASIALTVFHPGIFYPAMKTGPVKAPAGDVSTSEEQGEIVSKQHQ